MAQATTPPGCRTIVAGPDGSWLTQYYDETGQPLHTVIADDDPDNTSPAPELWASKVVRNSDGRITIVHSPANVTGYIHSRRHGDATFADGVAYDVGDMPSSVAIVDLDGDGDTA